MNSEIDFLDEEWKMPTNFPELAEIIDAQMENIPDRRTKKFVLWRDKMNLLIDYFNNKIGFKAFKNVLR